MTKEDMLRLMGEMINNMEPFFQEAGVRAGYLQIPKGSKKLNPDYIKQGYVWLREIETGPIQKVKNIKKSLPEEVWNRYKLWEDFHNHNEMVHLKRALNELRTRIVSRSRPNYFKRVKVTQAIKAEEKRERKQAKQAKKNRKLSRNARKPNPTD